MFTISVKLTILPSYKIEQLDRRVTVSKINKDKWSQGPCEVWKVPPKITGKDCNIYKF